MAEVHPLEPHPPNGAAAGATQPETIGRKRQRRPSVRLGDIGGDQGLLYDAAGTGGHPRRGGGAGNKQCRAHSNQSQNLSDSDCKKDGILKASSRTRALTNLAGTLEEEKELNLDAVAIGSWKVRDTKRRVAALPAAARRARSNWGKDSKFEDTGGNGSNVVEDSCGGGRDDVAEAEEEDDGYSGRGFNVEDSESPAEEGNVNGGEHVNSLENSGDGNERYEKGVYCSGRKGGSFSRLDSDNDVREYGNNNAGCSGRGGGEDAVRIWLNSIGLGRYAPVFEIHEVDDEVLPMLTLEDLKDMGISAVGSRRKMFCSIQKLGRGFS